MVQGHPSALQSFLRIAYTLHRPPGPLNDAMARWSSSVLEETFKAHCLSSATAGSHPPSQSRFQSKSTLSHTQQLEAIDQRWLRRLLSLTLSSGVVYWLDKHLLASSSSSSSDGGGDDVIDSLHLSSNVIIIITIVSSPFPITRSLSLLVLLTLPLAEGIKLS